MFNKRFLNSLCELFTQGIIILGLGASCMPLVSEAQQSNVTQTLHTSTSSGNGTSMDVSGLSLAGILLQGTSGCDRVVTFQIANSDNETFSNVGCRLMTNSTYDDSFSLSSDIPVRVQCPVGGFKRLRVVISGGTTGTVSVKGTAMDKVSVLPSTSGGGGGAGDIESVWECTTGDCEDLVAAAGDSLDAGSADFLRVPTSAGAAPTVSGRIAYDSTANAWEGGVNGVNKAFAMTDSNITGNAATATALAGNPTDCAANEFATTIAASGNLTCAGIVDADVPNTITIDLATAATALAANPSDCAANQFATTIAANGNLTCAGIVDADVPNTITIDLATTATALAANPTDCGVGEFATAIAANGNLTCSTPSGGSGDITDVWGCTTGNCNALTAAAGDSLNAGSADSTAPLKVGTSPPGTCAVGDYFYDSDATAGSNTFACTATNTWTLQGGGAAPGAASSQSEGALVRREATQSVSNNTDTLVSWDTEDRDDNSYYSGGSPTRLTIPATGWYTGCTTVDWAFNATGSRYLHHRINGINTWLDQIGANLSEFVTRCWTEYLTASDYIEVNVFQDSGSSLTIQGRSTIVRWGQPAMPASQTIAATNTITADACGGIKRITAAGAVTTNTTNTFTAPAAANANCVMHVCNVGSDAITLDANANFQTINDADISLGDAECVSVGSTGASGVWYQLAPTSEVDATIVRTNQANTWTTGAQSMSAATSLTVPASAAYAPTADASVGYDTTRDSYVVGSTIGATGTTGHVPLVLKTATDNTDTLDAATITTTETVFTKNFTVPANFLLANKTLEFRASGKFTSSGSPPSVTFRLRYGGISGTILYASNTGSVAASRTNEGWSVVLNTVNSGASGAAASLFTHAISAAITGAGGLPPTNSRLDQPVTADTTSSKDLVLTIQFSAGTAGNTFTLQQLLVIGY